MAKRRPARSILGALFWYATGMAVAAAIGFFLARDFFAPNYLEPSAVRQAVPRPVRILSPDEARAMAGDRPSHVWTKGVTEADIPKLEPKKKPEQAPRRRVQESAPRPETAEAGAEATPPSGEQPAAGEATPGAEGGPPVRPGAATPGAGVSGETGGGAASSARPKKGGAGTSPSVWIPKAPPPPDDVIAND